MLKLLSGLMMLGLGLLLWFALEMLCNVFIAAGLLGGAALLSVIIITIQRKVKPKIRS